MVGNGLLDNRSLLESFSIGDLIRGIKSSLGSFMCEIVLRAPFLPEGKDCGGRLLFTSEYFPTARLLVAFCVVEGISCEGVSYVEDK